MGKRRWCSGIMQDSHSCDPGSIPGRRNFEILKEKEIFVKDKRNLPDGELNPGLPRDRRGSLPLDYQGLDSVQEKSSSNYQPHCHRCYICGKEI